MGYPEFIKGWETVELLGSGGFGKVYKIRRIDNDLGEVYSALKVIDIPKDESDYRSYLEEGYDEQSISTIFKSQVNNIISETEMMFKFQGAANIVHFEGHAVIPRGIGYRVLIKMELLETLAKKNNDFPLSEEEIIKVGMDICKALELCHNEKIVHRDVKPQNIFVNRFGNYKLGDFGVSKIIEGETRATKIGTYGYIAPEIYHGNPYGFSTDIYSLGLVLYWLLNERRSPFLPLPPAVPSPSDNDEANLKRLSGCELPPPAHGSQELKSIILKACSYYPQNRFSTVAEMYDALESAKIALKNRQVGVESTFDAERTIAVNDFPNSNSFSDANNGNNFSGANNSNNFSGAINSNNFSGANNSNNFSGANNGLNAQNTNAPKKKKKKLLFILLAIVVIFVLLVIADYIIAELDSGYTSDYSYPSYSSYDSYVSEEPYTSYDLYPSYDSYVSEEEPIYSSYDSDPSYDWLISEEEPYTSNENSVADAYSVFNNGYVSFEYPSYFTVSEEVGVTTLMNTATGDNITIAMEYETDMYENITEKELEDQLSYMGFGVDLFDFERETVYGLCCNEKIISIYYWFEYEGLAMEQQLLIVNNGGKTITVTFTAVGEDVEWANHAIGTFCGNEENFAQ